MLPFVKFAKAPTSFVIPATKLTQPAPAAIVEKLNLLKTLSRVFVLPSVCFAFFAKASRFPVAVTTPLLSISSTNLDKSALIHLPLTLLFLHSPIALSLL